MKRHLAVAGLLIVAVSARGGALEERAADSRVAVQELMSGLQTHLQAAIKDGGPVNAIGVCNLQAPRVSGDVSTERGWKVGRTSLRVRNPGNAPDAWERDVMETFAQRKAAGEDPKTMEYYEVVESEGVENFRYMKAIPTGEVCLACHGGDSVSPETAAAIHELYPDDAARGFAAGDIRGAFTVTQPIN